MSSCFVKTITLLQELPVLFHNFTEIFSTSKTQTSSMLTFVWTFWLFELSHVQIPASCSSLWMWQCIRICLHHVVTLQGVMFYSSEFQPSSITVHKLLVSSCSVTVVFFTSKFWTSSMLIFVWPFELSKLAQGQASFWTSPVLLVWCCNVMRMFFTSTYRRSSIMTFVCPFWTFKLVQGQFACEHNNS